MYTSTLSCLYCQKTLSRPGYDIVALTETARKKGWRPVFLRLGAAAEWTCPECAAKAAKAQSQAKVAPC